MWIRLFVLSACLLALAACDPPTLAQPEGGTGGGTFTLVYTYPKDKATGIPTDSPLVVIFNEDVDPASLEGNLAVAKTGGGVVKGAITYDSPDFQATVTPPGTGWTGTSEYTLTVKTGVKSKDGTKTLDKEYTVGFKTK